MPSPAVHAGWSEVSVQVKLVAVMEQVEVVSVVVVPSRTVNVKVLPVPTAALIPTESP